MNNTAAYPISPARTGFAELLAIPEPSHAGGERTFTAKMLVFAIAAIGGYFFSLWYLDAYYAGDLAHYRNFYEAIARAQPDNWAKLQGFYIGSSEPAYRLVMGASTYVDISRNTFIALWNAVLVGGISVILYEYRVSPIFTVLLFTNFYFLIMLGPAERLKFAYLLFILALLVQKTSVRAVLALMSIFFHTQALIQFLSAGIYFVVDNWRMILVNPTRTIIASIGGLAVGSVTLYFFIGAVWNSILNKSQIYAARSEGFVEMIPWTLLLLSGGYLFRNRVAYVAAMLPLGALTYLFGNRVNITTLALFAALAIFQRKTQNPIILLVMAYLSYKSILYFQNILAFGSGFN